MKTVKLMLALCLVVSFGCDKPKPQATTEDPGKVAEANEPEKTAESKPSDEKVAPVMLSATGTKFDPPIKPEQLSEGAVYCDMGTVHWAATKSPDDSKCPECYMKLKTYAAAKVDAQNKKAVNPAHGEEGHKHGDGHDHGDHKHGDEKGHDHGDHKH